MLTAYYGIGWGCDSLSLHAAGLTAFYLMHLIWGSEKIMNLTEKKKDD